MEGLGPSFTSLIMERYSRQTVLPEIGVEGQEKLREAKVLVIGAGGLGSPVIQYLAAAGVGHLSIVDPDVVSLSNLQRQTLYRTDDIGKSKAELAAQFIRALNPDCKVKIFKQYFNPDLAHELVPQHDVIVDGSDNFSCRYLSNDASVIYNKPLVAASILKFEGQLSVYNYNNGPSYRCLFPEPPSADEVPSCAEAGVLGSLAGVMGSLQANEVLKVLLSLDEIMSEKLLVYNSLKNSFDILSFVKNPANFTLKDLKTHEINCSTEEENFPDQMDVADLKKWQEEGRNFTLLDVREDWEHKLTNLGGLHIPLGEILSQPPTLPSQHPIVVYCHHGIRSAHAIQALKSMGLSCPFINLNGGIHAYALSFPNEAKVY